MLTHIHYIVIHYTLLYRARRCTFHRNWLFRVSIDAAKTSMIDRISMLECGLAKTVYICDKIHTQYLTC